MNNTILALHNKSEVNIELLFAKQWLNNNESLPENCPIRGLDFLTFPFPERIVERLWKATSYPRMDHFIPANTDWVYAPMETLFPTSKVPVAFTIYDIQAFETNLPWSNTKAHKRFRYRWEKWIWKAINQSRIVFTISEFSKQRISTLLQVNPDKIINIGCGVEQPFLDVAALDPSSMNLPVSDPYLFMIGGLREKKGAYHLLATANELKKQKSNIQIVVAGPSEDAYIQAAKEYDNVHLLGMVPDDELPILLRGALGLLFLSLYEGFGIPALEAMAAGVPAIVSNRASLPEVVGEGGLVVDPEKPAEIASLLMNLASDDALRKQIVDEGFRQLQHYSWDLTADKIVSAFNVHA